MALLNLVFYMEKKYGNYIWYKDFQLPVCTKYTMAAKDCPKKGLNRCFKGYGLSNANEPTVEILHGSINGREVLDLMVKYFF